MKYSEFIIDNINQTVIAPISEWQNILVELCKGNGVYLLKPDGTAMLLQAGDLGSHDYSLYKVKMDGVKI